jgi:hypothetical protein
MCDDVNLGLDEHQKRGGRERETALCNDIFVEYSGCGGEREITV